MRCVGSPPLVRSSCEASVERSYQRARSEKTGPAGRVTHHPVCTRNEALITDYPSGEDEPDLNINRNLCLAV